MILIANINLAIDSAIDVERLHVGEVHRSGRAVRSAGGKGVNVARALRVFGREAHVLGCLGGETGREIARRLRDEGIAHSHTRVQGESRTCLILNDPTRNEQTVLNEPGPALSPGESARFVARYRSLLCNARAVVITGSLPPGAASDTYVTLVEIARRQGKIAFLDAAGEPLRAGLGAAPDWVKVNRLEAEGVLALPAHANSAEAAAAGLRALGAGNAMITLGAEGAVVATESGIFRIVAPSVNARIAVGAGDAAMAGLVAAVLGGHPPEECGRLAVATGSAGTLHGAGRCERSDIESILPAVTASRVGAA